MIRRYKVLITLFFGLSIIIIFLNSGTKQKNNFYDLPIKWNNAKYIIDVDNPEEVVGVSDYVFAGCIEEKLDTIYINPDTKDGRPATIYNITVMKNIKGNLEQGASIEVKKIGGIAKDKTYIALDEGDILPQEGRLYIFSAIVSEKGELVCSMPNSCVPVDVDTNISSYKDIGNNFDNDEIVKLDIFKKYEKSYKNEIKFKRERYIFKYDKSYKK